MTSIIEKRRSLHRVLEDHQKQIDRLRFQINRLQPLANLGTTMAMIAHEMNNLLTPVANYAQLAQQNPNDTELAEKAVSKAQKNTRRACQIMESLLCVARGEIEKKQKIDLRSLIDEVFNCLARDFSRDGITVNIDIPENTELWAVPVQLQQVFMNLILNARKAMLQSRGTLTIKAHQDEDGVQIRISDTGKGIAPGNLKKIFTPFFTTDETETKDDENAGSGLGLVFCKQVIDDHDGSITVESIPEHGTTFRITLPACNTDFGTG